jgi:hypothetical protein
MTGPALSSLTGAYIISEYHENWRYSQWVILIIATPIAIMTLFMSETFTSRILYLRQKAEGGKPAHQSGDTARFLGKMRTSLIKPLHMMLMEPLVAYLSIYTGFAFAMMFSSFGSYSFVLQTIYDFD